MLSINTPILITGLPRSGTSLVAGCIKICGAFGGDLEPANRWCEKGFFENTEIRTTIVKTILWYSGFCDVGVLLLPPVNHPFKSMNIKNSVNEIIKKQGYNFDRPWFFKDAKLCLQYKLWQRAFPNAVWIVVSRNKESVLESCKKSFMSNNNLTDEQWNKWHWDYTEHIHEMSKNVKVNYISSDNLMAGVTTQLEKITDMLGLKCRRSVLDFIDNKLWHY